jgi:hypothetical protein
MVHCFNEGRYVKQMKVLIYAATGFVVGLGCPRALHADAPFSRSEIRELGASSKLKKCAWTSVCPHNITVFGETYDIDTVDVNDDGVMEISLRDNEGCIRDGCNRALLQLHDRQWRLLFAGDMCVLLGKTSGFHDIVVCYERRAWQKWQEAVRNVYCWNGSQYQQCGTAVIEEASEHK